MTEKVIQFNASRSIQPISLHGSLNFNGKSKNFPTIQMHSERNEGKPKPFSKRQIVALSLLIVNAKEKNTKKKIIMDIWSLLPAPILLLIVLFKLLFWELQSSSTLSGFVLYDFAEWFHSALRNWMRLEQQSVERHANHEYFSRTKVERC